MLSSLCISYLCALVYLYFNTCFSLRFFYYSLSLLQASSHNQAFTTLICFLSIVLHHVFILLIHSHSRGYFFLLLTVYTFFFLHNNTFPALSYTFQFGVCMCATPALHMPHIYTHPAHFLPGINNINGHLRPSRVQVAKRPYLHLGQ